MSRSRHDLHKARLRRERIRQEKQGQRSATESREAPAAPVEHRFAAERSLRQIQALIEGQKFDSLDQLNAQLSDLTRSGRLLELAEAWKRDDPKWRAQELAYDALETDDFGEALRLIDEALKLDADCTDAQRLMVSLVPATVENKIQLMTEVVDKAQRNFGAEFFRENAGHFWGNVATRPYMRAKQHLGELLIEAQRLEEAAKIFVEMLELNPDDNQGVRYQLIGVYLACGQTERAAALMSRFLDEENSMGVFAWARVLERWQAGKRHEAELALANARRVNPFVEKYIAGARKPPEQEPEYFTPGKESEAQVCARELTLACERNPGFRDWLRQRQ